MIQKLLDFRIGISPKQELLLKAGILPPGDALVFWQKWRAENKISDADIGKKDILSQIFDPLDYDSQRLLALVYSNLEKSGDPVIGTLRGYFRYSWMKGSIFVSKAAELVDKLQKEGFDVMLLKGIPLAMMYYKNVGARPMEDIDVFVPFHQLEAVLKFLAESCDLVPNENENNLYKLGMVHAMHFNDSNGLDFDLHWHFHSYNLNAESDRPMWDKKIPFTVAPDVKTYTLSPTHQLYRNFTHGYEWIYTASPIRWVPDSLVILNASADLIDWDELFDLATKQNLILPVCSMLHYLRKNFSVVLPDKVLAKIETLKISLQEQYYFKLLIAAENHHGQEWKYFVNKTSRIFLRYRLFQMRDINDSFPVWLVKKVKYTLVYRKIKA